jgi:RimJ/RimL family protein N-acetyltransferase
MLRGMVLLNTERLVLRGLEMRDAPALFALYSDREVMRHWSHEPWTALSQAEAAIREAQDEYASRRSLHLAIEKRAGPHGGTLIGSCALYNFARTPGELAAHVQRVPVCATLGYLLAHPHWGRGYAAEALHALLGHGFGLLGLTSINAEVAQGNDASMNLLTRLGFRSNGTVRGHWTVAGRACDVEAFSLHHSDYNLVHAE